MGARVVLKAENLQLTGSFKARGATNMIGRLLRARRWRAGVVAASAGNHAQAVAFAARDAGARAVLVMPAAGARSRRSPRCASTAARCASSTAATTRPAPRRARLAEEEGLTIVHAFDQPQVVAGQGTVGLEIARAGARA